MKRNIFSSRPQTLSTMRFQSKKIRKRSWRRTVLLCFVAGSTLFVLNQLASSSQDSLRVDDEKFQEVKPGGDSQGLKILDGNGKMLPSAKTLLTKPPPFSDADVIKLSDSTIKTPNTIVTAYFRVPSKFKPGKYDAWMRNMLSLQDAMVIFTHRDLVSQIKDFRSHALNRTVIVPLELDELPIGTLYSKDFWEEQLDKDPEKKIHRSYQLLWIWLSKTWCTTEAIRLNFFQSDLFVWSDIGCFRDSKYNSLTMIRYRENVPPNEMIQMAHHKPNPPKEVLWANKYKEKQHYYHSGSQFAAYKDTWKIFHENFLETIDKFLERNMFIGEDQHVLQSVCLQHPELCAYIPFTMVKDNHYFGLRWVLHNDVKLNYWRQNKLQSSG